MIVRFLVALTACGVWWWSMEASAWADPGLPARPLYGPLRLVNQQPLQLLFLQPFPDVAAPVPVGRGLVHLNVALTNTLVGQDAQPWSAHLDLEMVRTVLDVRYGILPQVELGLEVPLLYTYGGILDDFILGVERVLTPGHERSLRKRQRAGTLTYRVLRGPRLVIEGQDDALGLGDVVTKAKVRVLHEQGWWPTVSLRAAVKWPSGDTARAFGSGQVDGGVGVIVQKTLGRWTVYTNLDLTVPGPAFEDAGVSLQPFVSGILAVEYRLARPLSLVGQWRGDTRPFHGTIPILDKRLFETLVGVNWALARQLVLQVGLAEDQLNSACCSADVSFFLNLTGRL